MCGIDKFTNIHATYSYFFQSTKLRQPTDGRDSCLKINKYYVIFINSTIQHIPNSFSYEKPGTKDKKSIFEPKLILTVVWVIQCWGIWITIVIFAIAAIASWNKVISWTHGLLSIPQNICWLSIMSRIVFVGVIISSNLTILVQIWIWYQCLSSWVSKNFVEKMQQILCLQLP